jgi:hypothetical protein
MQDLSSLIDPVDPLHGSATLDFTNDINDAGDIVGEGMIAGVPHALLFSPVPEASLLTLALVGLGITTTVVRFRPLKDRHAITDVVA